LVGIEVGQGLFDPFTGGCDQGQAAIGVESHFLHTDRAFETAPARQGAVVVKQVGFAFEINQAGVVGERPALADDVHDGVAIGPGAGGAFGRGIRQVLGNTTGRVQQVIGILTLVQPGSFLVRRGAFDGILVPDVKTLLGQRFLHHTQRLVVRQHVVVQLDVPEIGVAPI